MTPPDKSSRAQRQISILGGTERRGSWPVPEKTVMFSLVGGADLDMTEARFSAPEVTITWWSVLGGLTLIVPPGTAVDVTGFRLLGGRDVSVADSGAAGGKTVHVVANSLIGGVKVRSA